MPVVLLVSTCLVVALLSLLQPLVADEVTSLREQSPWVPDAESGESEPRESPPEQGSGPPVADGRHVCQNCGARLEGEFTYCGQCLTAVV